MATDQASALSFAQILANMTPLGVSVSTLIHIAESIALIVDETIEHGAL
jgi:hypothetical protein